MNAKMEDVAQAAMSKPLVLVGTVAVLSTLYFVAKAIYILYVDPLSKIPGPKVNALSRLPYVKHLLAGTTVNNTVELHKKYGEVVRISPNEVSFISGETAWPDIYGFRTGRLKGHANMQKDPAWYPPPANGAPSILIANDEVHSRGRRLLSHAFSEKALAEQEVLLQKYVDQTIDRLKETTAGTGQFTNMVKWFNWFTFDVIADLLFGEPFGCLQELRSHKYVELLFRGVKAFSMFYIMRYFPWVKYVGSLVIDKRLLADRKQFFFWVDSQVKKRLGLDTQRPDFMTYILKHNGGDGEKQIMSDDEMTTNAFLLLSAGSETTATLLSGATYLLLTHPAVLQTIKDEVRGRWESYDDITLEQVNNAPYLVAVLTEALRFYPPVPTGFERRVSQPGGEMVSGYFMPEGTALCVSQYAANHWEHHFKNANSFVPERWLDDPEYKNDRRSVLQPFSFGPRNCLGKNLAYAEMRLMLAKLIWSFDLEMDPSSERWIERSKVFTLWEKPELAVRLTEVKRD